MPDALRLVIGTLTRVPVPPPRRVDRSVAGVAMAFSPLVGMALAVVIGGIVQVLAPHLPPTASPLLLAALVIGVLAFATRALHLDGLADTADALGSGRPAAGALEIARRSDIGPFGVVTLVLVLLVQVLALAGLIADGRSLTGLLVALGTSRLAIVVACRRGVPAARSDGLGAMVAGSLAGWVVVAEVTGWLVLCLAAGLLWAPAAPASAVLAATGGLVGAALMTRVCVRRLGGITGDTLGAAVELTMTVTLVILVVLPS